MTLVVGDVFELPTISGEHIGTQWRRSELNTMIGTEPRQTIEYCETPEQRTGDRTESMGTAMPETKTDGILVDDDNSSATMLCSFHNTIMVIAMSRQPITPIFQA